MGLKIDNTNVAKAKFNGTLIYGVRFNNVDILPIAGYTFELLNNAVTLGPYLITNADTYWTFTSDILKRFDTCEITLSAKAGPNYSLLYSSSTSYVTLVNGVAQKKSFTIRQGLSNYTVSFNLLFDAGTGTITISGVAGSGGGYKQLNISSLSIQVPFPSDWLTFSIDSETFAVPPTIATWADWLNSEYNTIGAYSDTDYYIYNDNGWWLETSDTLDYVKTTDNIINNGVYDFTKSAPIS